METKSLVNREAELHDDKLAEAASETSNRRLTIFLSGIAFFTGYVLSAGPAVFIARRLELPLVKTIIECLYAPLILIVKLNVPIVSPVIQAWVRLFR